MKTKDAFTEQARKDPGRQHDIDRGTRATWDVLIVDDESSHRAVLAVMLNEVGMRCMTAGGAAEALEVMRRRKMNAVIADLRRLECPVCSFWTRCVCGTQTWCF